MTATPDDSPDTLATFTRDGVAHIRFNRPQRLNALTRFQHLRVVDAVRRAEQDPSVGAIAFSGVGRAFCAGDDISGGAQSWPAERADRHIRTNAGAGPIVLQEATSVIRDAAKPTVAVLHGYAIGGGYDYATSCDFRVATPSCRIGDQRVLRALWAAEGWTYKSPRLIGLARAVRLGLFGEMITGEQAYEIGLVHHVLAADDDPLVAAAEFLARVSRLPARAYAEQKRRLHALLDLPAAAAGL